MRKIIQTFFCLWIIFGLYGSLTAQLQCFEGDKAFQAGETLEYRVSYNWGILWIDAGLVNFSVRDTVYNAQRSYHFYSTGMSFRRWDWLFKVRDTFEVITAASNLKPIWHKRHTEEGGYVIHNRYHFDHDQSLIFAEIEESRKPYHTLSIDMPQCTYDVLTATYLARSIDFSKVNPGDLLHINILVDDEVFPLPILYHGREVVRNRDKKRYDCYLFSAILDHGNMFKPGEGLYVWVSADKNRVPIMMEAKIAVGSVKIYLSEYSNLKQPLRSLDQ